MSEQHKHEETEAPEAICPAGEGAAADLQAERAQMGIGIFLILVVGFLAYFGAWRAPLHGEDLTLFAQSDALHRVVTFPRALDALPGAPLTLFGFAVNWSILSFPAGMRAVSLLLHLASAVLLYLIARRLLGRGVPEPVAMLAGLLLAVHPAATENVNCLAARPALQATFFSLLAIWFFLGGATASRLSAARLSAAMLAYALAVGSHMWALALPLLLLGFDARHGMRVVWRHSTVHGVFFGALVVFAVARAAAGEPGAAVYPAGLGETAAAVSQYAALTFKRILLLGGVSLPPAPVLENAPWWGGAAVAVLALLALVALARQSPAAAPLLWLVVAAVAIPVLAPRDTAFEARQAYFPLAGAALLLPWMFRALRQPKARVAAGVLAGAVVLVMAVLSFQQSALWRDPARLWQAAARQAPDSAEPWRNLGAFLRYAANQAESPEEKLALLAQAEEPLRNALERAPEDAGVMSDLGAVLHATGRQEEALPLLEEALRIDPFNQQAAIHAALLLEGRAQGDEGREALRRALDYFRTAEALGPLPAEARAHYGMVLAAFARYGEAAEHLAAAAPPGREDSPLAASRDQFKAMAERVQQLEAAARQKLNENPQGLEGLVGQAEAHVVRGHILDAFYLLDIALDREPGNQGAWQLMGFVCAEMDSTTQFLSEWSTPFAGNEGAWEQLAERCAAAGEWDGALAYLSSDVRGAESAEPPQVTLAEIALKLRQARRAYALLRQATEAHPNDPAPWLALADLAISGKDTANTRSYLEEAEKRGAFAEEIESRREKIGLPGEAAEPAEPVRSIIR